MSRRGGLAAGWAAARLAATAVAAVRLATVARSAPPLRPPGRTGDTAGREEAAEGISVVVPARDEADRIAPLLERVVGAPGVDEVIVVDDRSTDATADVARRSGATVVDGTEPPDGWAGKTWALHQGLERARGEWVVMLDADTRPDPDLPRALVGRLVADAADMISVGGRFDCPTGPARWLHASMLTSLVYRFGAPGAPVARGREMANGQCVAARRADLLAAGGFDSVAGEVVEDVAFARHLSDTGRTVEFLDGSDLLRVRMYESFPATWVGWSRSLALPGVEPRHRQVADLAVVALAQAAPLVRTIVRRRPNAIDLVGLALRLGTLAGTRSAYGRSGVGYWVSPLADPLTVAALGLGIVRGRRQTRRGRHYR